MALISLDKVLRSASAGGLPDLLRRAREATGLTASLRSALPPEARPSLVACNVREGGELVVLCSSSSWAARLRFETDPLLAAARAAGATVSRVTVKVARS